MQPLKTPCSNPASAGLLIVLEGMPGCGKTTAAAALAAEGHQVIGEYTTGHGATVPGQRHPAVDDDQAHQSNWLRKHQQAATAGHHAPVLLDRDWLSSLAYAASIADTDGGQLLHTRAAWAAQQLHHSRLAVADLYVVFHLDVATSIARRRQRLAPSHPWSNPTRLQQLARFYDDPLAALAGTHPELTESLRSATWYHLHCRSRERTLSCLRELLRRWSPQP